LGGIEAGQHFYGKQFFDGWGALPEFRAQWNSSGRVFKLYTKIMAINNDKGIGYTNQDESSGILFTESGDVWIQLHGGWYSMHNLILGRSARMVSSEGTEVLDPQPIAREAVIGEGNENENVIYNEEP
jgi:hypothetical protein